MLAKLPQLHQLDTAMCSSQCLNYVALSSLTRLKLSAIPHLREVSALGACTALFSLP